MSDDTIVDANDCKTSAATPASETVELIINDFIDKIKRNEDVNNDKDKDNHNEHENENDDEPLKIVESFEKTIESEESNISSSSNVGPKAKKSVTFNPNDEKIKKFITGEPIVDQRNPFKNAIVQREPKKTPPPVPTKRSTLSVRKTVTQQLREREREKEKEKEREKEREQQKNETNARKVKKINGNVNGGTPDDFITTEEVLKQSKYVKTYIKNPDPYFVYDPTVLARLKYEEFQEKIPKPKRKQTQNSQPSKAQRLTKSQQQQQEATKLPFKKCSKPNYPELANIKIRTGTPINGDYFNPAEVTKNAKKFDERVKKLQISSDDDLDEIDGPLTKSESSDELTHHNNNNNNNLNNHSNYSNSNSSSSNNDDSMNERNVQSQKMSNQSNGEPNEKLGTFTNTISSDEFQAYLERKGLALMPKRELLMSSPSSPSSTTTPTLTPSPLPYSNESPLVALRKNNSKKLSVLQRLSNSLFPTTRRKAIIMPKEMTTQPQPRAIYNGNKIEQGTPLEIRRRLLLEGQTKTTAAPQQHLQQQQQQQRLERNQMTPIELRRRQPVEHSTKRSIPKATVPQKRMLYNAENDEIRRLLLERSNKLSSNVPQQQQQQRTNFSTSDNEGRILLERSLNQQQQQQQQQPNQMGRRSIAEGFQRNTLERQSLIPLPRRGISPDVSMNRFNRSASMDRNQIKVMSRQQQPQQQAQPQPMATSTPVKEQQSQNEWEKLRAIKEVTDRQLYHKVLQQQQQQHQQQQQQQISEENIYEHLPTPTGYFIRGSAQRNTFSGIANTAAPVAAAANGGGHRNRQVMILDGTPIIHSAKQLQQQQPQQLQHIPTRSQSVLDDMIPTRRGYESETEMPPVVMRRKDGNGNGNGNGTGSNGHATTNRRIGGLLTREEILEKVKEFCRKSINRTPSKMQPIYEKQQHQQQQQHTHAEISPVSYASVERPLVPLRVQSLPQGQTPIYAHVNKRNSLLSNESEQYLSSQQLPQYVLVETEDGGIQAAKLLDYPNNSSIYNLQQQQHQQQLQQFMHTSGGYIRPDGRTTPLILDRGNSNSNNAGQQQASQIYWTPQHQRLQQHYQQQSNLMTIPRYSAAAAATATNFDRGYPIPAPRLNTNGHIAYGHVVVPAPRKLLTQQQQRQLQLQQQQPLAMRQFATSSDWECGSEAAGEIRRIMEKPL